MSEIMKYVNNMLGNNGVAKQLTEVWMPPTEVDLFRVCAVADQTFMSRYVFVRGVWEYSGPIIVSATVRQSLYWNKFPTSISSRDIGEEKCPHCGAYGSIIECGTCKKIVCRGRTTAAGFFRCRRSCKGEGQVKTGSTTNHGVAL